MLKKTGKVNNQGYTVYCTAYSINVPPLRLKVSVIYQEVFMFPTDIKSTVNHHSGPLNVHWEGVFFSASCLKLCSLEGF